MRWVLVPDDSERGNDDFQKVSLAIVAYIIMLIAIWFSGAGNFLWDTIKYTYSFDWVNLRWSESTKIILTNIFLVTAIPLIFIALMMFKFFSRFIYTCLMLLIDFFLAGFFIYLNFCSIILCFLFAITIGALIYYFVFIKLFPYLLLDLLPSLLKKWFDWDFGYDVANFLQDDDSWRIIWGIILFAYVIPMLVIWLW